MKTKKENSMKIINLLIILLFNLIGTLLSLCYHFQWVLRGKGVPITYYGLLYFCFILISIFILNRIKQPFALIFLGVRVGILINFVLSIIGLLIFNPIALLQIHNNIFFTIIILFISSLATLNFIIYPAVLLCCHYSIIAMQKVRSKIALKQQ